MRLPAEKLQKFYHCPAGRKFQQVEISNFVKNKQLR